MRGACAERGREARGEGSGGHRRGTHGCHRRPGPARDPCENEEENEEGNPAEDGESFTASTRVLLANGKTAPISSLRVGEKVLATSTTGRTQPETVMAVLIHHDKDLYNLKIKNHGKTAVIHATSYHLFWVPSTGNSGHWVQAAQLKPGTRLRTPDSSDTATVIDGWYPQQSTGTMWDLTIPGNNDHDFYITTIAGPVLVHNSNCMDLSGATQVKGKFPLTGGPANGTLNRGDVNGNVTNYAEYDVDGNILRRVDLTGRSHAGIPTPHVQPYVHDVAPDGTIYPRQVGVCAAGPSDIPC